MKKLIVTTITLILTLSIAATFVALPFVSAHDPPIDITTYSYLNVAPKVVGVGQTVFIMYWLNTPPPTALGAYGDRWHGITIEVTKPDGSTESLGPFTSDPVGGAVTPYTPTQVGTYYFKGIFPGQTLAGDNPDPIVSRGGEVYIDDYFEPSTSSSVPLTVQQDAISEPSGYPLPTEYWQRPIEGQNTNWYTIASNWLGKPKINIRFQPDGAAPNTAHISWVKEYVFGGVVGGSDTGIPGMTYYTGLNYEAKFQTPIIINGRLYYELPLSNNNRGGGFVCVDLATGEELWRQDITGIQIGQLYDFEAPNQHGVIANGYLWKVPGRGAPPDTPWEAYDPLTGKLVFSIINVPSGTQAYGPKGELLIYQLNYAKRWLACWNNTASPELLGTTTSSGAWQWRPVGKTINGSTSYSWNVTIPDLPGLSNPSIVQAFPNDLLLGRSSTFATTAAHGGTQDPYTFWAISLKAGEIGKLLWIKDYPAPAGDITRTVFADPGWPLVDKDTRVFLMRDVETKQDWGYSIDTGELLWGPTDPEDSDWDFFFSTGGQLSCKTIAYGNLYSAGYSGILYCYDLETGQLEWKYNNTYAGFATPYGHYPLGIGAIADGKVYMFSSEHSPTSPYWTGATIRCVDAYTGDELWTMYGYAGVGSNNGMAVADGYLIYLNLYDMQLYCVGKGPSETKISAPDMGVPLRKTVLITGSVIDIAAGAMQYKQSARFPSGVAAVSDESMSEWMEYVYMQKPCPENAEGVEVVITTLDPNGNTYELGRTTTSLSGTFGCEVQPPVPGLYKIIATFEGTESYYGSYAETYLVVEESTSAGQQLEPEIVEPTQTTETLYITTELIVILAVVTIAVIALAGFYIFRKQQ